MSEDAFFTFSLGAAVGLFFGFIFGVVLYYFLSQSNKAKTKETADTLLSQINLHLAAMSAEALTKNSDRFFSMAQATLSHQVELGEQDLETKKQLIDQTLEEMRKELNGVNGMVTELEKDRESKFGELTQQLKQAAEQTGKLQETTEKLRIALSNSKSRGQWGERMAEDVLRAAGFIEGVNYYKQQVLADSQNKPDYTFLLPRGRKVHMDVKFPIDNYLRYLESENEELKLQFRNRFIQDVRGRVKEVTKRDYIDLSDNTINYVIVFIPNEQLFTFVCQEDAQLLDSAMNSKVILCSPLTLFAILAVIRQAIDNFYLEEKTLKVLKVFDAFNKQWINYSSSFDALGKKIEAVQSEYISLTTRRRNQLDRQLMKIEELRQGQEGTLVLDIGGDEAKEADEG
jgi:DNA recombination protein RmuC